MDKNFYMGNTLQDIISLINKLVEEEYSLYNVPKQKVKKISSKSKRIVIRRTN